MVPAAIVVLVVFLALCGAVAVLWLDREDTTNVKRANAAHEFEIDRLKKWTKMPEDYRGGPAT